MSSAYSVEFLAQGRCFVDGRHFTEGFYDKFVDDVAKGRGMSVEAVHEVAQGRIWAGRSALEIGLIDRIGGLSEAIRLAKEDAGIPAGEEVAFKVLPAALGFWEVMSGDADEAFTKSMRLPETAERILEEAAYMEILQEDPNLYLMPYKIEVE